jgi:hypothetical protein
MQKNTRRWWWTLVVLFLMYLWAELSVGLFFQDSWGGQ